MWLVTEARPEPQPRPANAAPLVEPTPGARQPRPLAEPPLRQAPFRGGPTRALSAAPNGRDALEWARLFADEVARLKADDVPVGYTWSNILVPICWIANSAWRHLLYSEWERAGLLVETLTAVAARLAQVGARDPPSTLAWLHRYASRSCWRVRLWGYIPRPGQEMLMERARAGYLVQHAVLAAVHSARVPHEPPAQPDPRGGGDLAPAAHSVQAPCEPRGQPDPRAGAGDVAQHAVLEAARSSDAQLERVEESVPWADERRVLPDACVRGGSDGFTDAQLIELARTQSPSTAAWLDEPHPSGAGATWLRRARREEQLLLCMRL